MLRSLTLPVLVTHGAEDKNTNLIAAEYTAKMIPGAKLSIYHGIGHSRVASNFLDRCKKVTGLKGLLW